METNEDGGTLSLEQEYAELLVRAKLQMANMKAKEIGRAVYKFMAAPFADPPIHTADEARLVQILVLLEDRRLAIINKAHEPLAAAEGKGDES